jgi:hypothetical protein
MPYPQIVFSLCQSCGGHEHGHTLANVRYQKYEVSEKVVGIRVPLMHNGVSCLSECWGSYL